MRGERRRAGVARAALGLAIAISSGCRAAPANTAPNPSLVHLPSPSDAVLRQSMSGVCTQSSGYDNPGVVQGGPELAGWLLFLAVNCPAGTGQAQPRVWETWKPIDAVYLPGGKVPAPWGSPLPPRALLDRPQIDGHSLFDATGQPVLTEIRLNQAAFDYVVQRQLYSRAAQLRFFADADAAPIAFPLAAMEIKAAWLILKSGDSRNSRYYTAQASYVDPNGGSHSVLAGLAGFHVTSKVLPTWFWTTFEHVDNASRTGAPVTVPIPPTVRAMNDAVHAALPESSVWRYYDMRGVQTEFVDTAGASSLLSNTLIETNFQLSSSCITCHGLAARGSASQGMLGFFQTNDGGARGYVGALDGPSNRYADAFGARVCYDAVRAVFTNCQALNPAVVYKPLDFVWSLREAK